MLAAYCLLGEHCLLEHCSLGNTACWSTAYRCPSLFHCWLPHCREALLCRCRSSAVLGRCCHDRCITNFAALTVQPHILCCLSPCCLTSCAASHRAASPLVLPSPSPGAATGEQRLPFNGLGGHSGPVSAVALRSTPEKRLFVYSSSYDCTVTRLFLYALYRLQRSAQPTANHTA